MSTTITVTNASAFQAGQVVSFFGRTIPTFAKWKLWQAYDLEIFEAIYRVIGKKWFRDGVVGTYTINAVTSTTLSL